MSCVMSVLNTSIQRDAEPKQAYNDRQIVIRNNNHIDEAACNVKINNSFRNLCCH